MNVIAGEGEIKMTSTKPKMTKEEAMKVFEKCLDKAVKQVETEIFDKDGELRTDTETGRKMIALKYVMQIISITERETEKMIAKRLLKHYKELGDDEVIHFMASEDFAPIDKVNYCHGRVEDVIKKYKKYKIFHDHIKAHFEVEHPDWEVCCKICDKTIDQIYKQYKNELKLVKEMAEK